MTAFPSPNHGDRRGQVPSLIVIHYTGMADSPSARARLCDAAAEVSAHWLVDADGTTEQLVCETRRAWHAGAGRWQGLDDVNSRSIGIELANPGDRPYPAPQMDALRRLLRDIMDRWSIGPAAVIGHSDLAPGRKIDPGPRFDWLRLARLGLAFWPDPADIPGHADPDPQAFGEALTQFGYPDAEFDARLSAFRLRFRPGVLGPLSAADMALARALPQREGDPS